MMAELKQQVGRQGLPYDAYLQHLGKTEEQIRKEQRAQAERRVKMSLVLNAVQEAEKLEPSAERVEAEIGQQVAGAPDDETRKRLGGDDFKRYVTRVLGNQLAVERLMQLTGAAPKKAEGPSIDTGTDVAAAKSERDAGK